MITTDKSEKSPLLGDGNESYPLFFGCCYIIGLIVVGVLVAGAVFGCYVYFKNYDNDFAALHSEDIRLEQEIYSDAQARELKDILLTQQNSELAAEIPPESAIRMANYLILLYAIQNETAIRIAEQQILFDRLANETADRIAADALLEPQIVNITMMVEMAEQFNIFSMSKFMILMNNITNLDTRLTQEIDLRRTLHESLTQQGQQADATLVYLFDKLAKEVHERSTKDGLLQEQLDAISGYDGLKLLNGLGPIDSRMIFTSPNPVTTFENGGGTNPNSGHLVFVNNGIGTINGVPRNETTKNIDFVAGERMFITQTGTHEITVATDLLPTPPNIVELTGVNAITYGTPDMTLAGTCFDFAGNVTTCGPAAKKSWLPVLPMDCSQRGFPLYNGNTCGWSAPSNGTFVVEMVVTFSVTLSYPWGNRLSIFSLAIPELGPSTASCDIAYPEAGGCMKIVDTVTVGGSLYTHTFNPFSVTLMPFNFWPKLEIDVSLKTTEIIKTDGMDTSGCFNGMETTCGYLMNPVYTVDVQPVTIRATRVDYTVSKIADIG